MPALHEAQLRHARHFEAILREVGSSYVKGENVLESLAAFDEEWANIRSGAEWVAANASKDEAASLCVAYQNSGAHLLDLRRPPQERVNWLERVLVIARRLGRRSYEASALSNLGIACFDVGRTQQAKKYFEEALAISKETGNHRRAVRFGMQQVVNKTIYSFCRYFRGLPIEVV